MQITLYDANVRKVCYKQSKKNDNPVGKGEHKEEYWV
jgi:hypothetical protein